VFQRDSLFNQAREMGSDWIEGLPLDASDRLIDRLIAVTPEQVQHVAKTYFGDDNLTVATLLPQSGPRPPLRKPPPKTTMILRYKAGSAGLYHHRQRRRRHDEGHWYRVFSRFCRWKSDRALHVEFQYPIRNHPLVLSPCKPDAQKCLDQIEV
jgi:hypothetical protein